MSRVRTGPCGTVPIRGCRFGAPQHEGKPAPLLARMTRSSSMVDRTADFKAALRQRRTVLGLQTPSEELMRPAREPSPFAGDALSTLQQIRHARRLKRQRLVLGRLLRQHPLGKLLNLQLQLHLHLQLQPRLAVRWLPS